MTTSVFIYGHGCYVENKIPHNPNINLFFDSEINACSIGDFTNPDFNSSNFTLDNRKNDYIISFVDEFFASDIEDFNSLGVYIKNGPQGEFVRANDFRGVNNTSLSEIIKYLYDYKYISKNVRINIYCSICRLPCGSEAGIAKRKRKYKLKNKTKRKNKYKKKSYKKIKSRKRK